MSVFLTAKLLKVICSDKDYADLYNLLAPKTYEMAYTSTFSAPQEGYREQYEEHTLWC